MSAFLTFYFCQLRCCLFFCKFAKEGLFIINLIMSIVCQSCRTYNPDNARFCNNCGKPLFKKCPACGSTVFYSTNFCTNCGCNLNQDFVLYDSIEPLGTDHFKVKMSLGYKVFSAVSLQPVNDEVYEGVWGPCEGLIVVSKNNKTGLLVLSGLKQVLPIVYDSISLRRIYDNCINAASSIAIVGDSIGKRVFNPRTGTWSSYYERIVSGGKKIFVGKPYSFRQLFCHSNGRFTEFTKEYRYEDIFEFYDENWYVKEGNSAVKLSDNGIIDEKYRYYFKEQWEYNLKSFIPYTVPHYRILNYPWLSDCGVKHVVVKDYEKRKNDDPYYRFVDRNGIFLTKPGRYSYTDWETTSDNVYKKHRIIRIDIKQDLQPGEKFRKSKYTLLKVNSLHDLSKLDALADM